MLPFDSRPWAKPVARTVIVLSFIAAALGAYYCYSTGQLHISEIAIIVLSLMAIVPPNVAIVLRKSPPGGDLASDSSAIGHQSSPHPLGR